MLNWSVSFPSNLQRTCMNNAMQVHDSSAARELQVRSSTNPKQATADDERRMQEILANPEIKEILLDPRVQMLIETLRTDPEKAQRLTKA